MQKIAIVGTGAVGSSIAYAIQIQSLVREIVLVDQYPEKAHGEALDLAHGAMFSPSVNVTDGSVEDCRDADLIVLAAGAKQKPGQSRLDLTKVNAQMLTELMPRLVRVAPDALFLIVSNPVDVLADIARRVSGLPPERVFGSGTVLDTSRLRHLLSRFFAVSPSNIHAYIVGEHGDSEIALWSSARLGGVPLSEVRIAGRERLTEEKQREIFEGVRGAAQQVIRHKGATNWAIGQACARIVRAISRDERAILTVGRRLDDYRGLSDVTLSAPCIVGRQGATEVLLLECDEEEAEAFRRSASVIAGHVADVGYG